MVFAYLVTIKLRRAEDVATFLVGFGPLLTFSNRNEAETLTYEIHRDESCDRTLLILERYQSSESLEAHRQSQAFQDFGAYLREKDIIESKSQGRFFTELLDASFAAAQLSDQHINGEPPKR